jgi:hypothetical protein
MNKGLSLATRAMPPADFGGFTAFGYAIDTFAYIKHYFAQFYSQLNQFIRLDLGALRVAAMSRFIWQCCQLRSFFRDTSMASGAATKGLGGTDFGNHAGAGFALTVHCPCAASRRPYPVRGAMTW